MTNRGVKLGNEYASALGEFYTNTPKAVFAALAFSYAACFGTPANGGDATEQPEEVIKRLQSEWLILKQNGIVPQEVEQGMPKRVTGKCPVCEKLIRMRYGKLFGHLNEETQGLCPGSGKRIKSLQRSEKEAAD
jgi:hypothetical protein